MKENRIRRVLNHFALAAGVMFAAGIAAYGYFAKWPVEATESHAHAHAHGGASAQNPHAAPASSEPEATAAATHEGHEHESKAGASGEAVCAEHNVAEALCAICGAEHAQHLEPGEGLLLRLAVGTDAGIETVQPEPGRAAAEMLPGRIAYNREQLAHVSSVVAGVLTEVNVGLGDKVRAGDVMAVLSCPDAAEAKGTYLSALAEEALAGAAHAREKDLHAKQICSTESLEQAAAQAARARAATQTAQQRLRGLGLSPYEVEQVRRDRDCSSKTPLRAPFDGSVIAREAVPGQAAEPGDALFTVADLSTMWLELMAPATSASMLKPGVEIEALPEGLGDTAVTGVIDWVDTSVNPESRTLKARAVLQNPEGLLKDGLYANVMLRDTADPHEALLLPEQAVQWVDDAAFVFLSRESGLFEVRAVNPGKPDKGKVEIERGLSGGESVVLAGAYKLKSEWQRAQMGDGCVDD